MYYVTFTHGMNHAKVFKTAGEAVNNYDPKFQTLHKVDDEFVDPSKAAELMNELRQQVQKRKFIK